MSLNKLDVLENPPIPSLSAGIGEQKNEQENRFELPLAFSFEELLSFKIPVPTPLVEGLLYLKNLSLVAAKPKVGKSTLCRFLSKAVVDGIDFLDRKTEPGVVLYLAIEEPLSNVQRDLLAMGIENRRDLIISCLSNVYNKHATIEGLVDQYRPSLVIVDTMIHGTEIRDVNDYAETTVAFKKFRDLAEKFNTHICFVHHEKKGDSSGNDSILGSTGLSGAVDSIISITLNKNDERIIKSNGRSDSNFDDEMLIFNPETKCFSLGSRSSDSLLEQIVEFVAKNPGTTRDELKKFFRKKNEVFTQAIRSLVPHRIHIVRESDRKDHFYIQTSESGEE